MRTLFLLLILAMPARADIRVVTDIAPVHSLVATVMEGAGTPELLVRQGVSVHHYAMRPSEAQALTDADVVIWIGEGLAPWMHEPIETLAKDALSVPLMEAEGVHLLPFREGALFSAEGEEGHDHDHDHDHGHEGEGEGSDPHVWLDPGNGQVFLDVIAKALSDADPENAALYAQNAAKGQAALQALEAEINAKLAPARGVPFIVLHDGFHYFEAHFEIEAIGAISATDAQTPGAARMKALREALPDRNLACAFDEPNSGQKLLETATEGLTIKTATLDPLGMDLDMGPMLYGALLMSMADAMAECLAP